MVDWQAVVLDLQAHVRAKNSHGQRELTDLIADLMVKHRQPEGLPEKVMRAYLPSVIEQVSRPPSPSRAVGSDGHGGSLAASQ